MLRLNFYAEWLYYWFWYCAARVAVSLPRTVAWKPASWGWKMRQPYYWIVQQGWVFPYLYTLEERQAMSSNNQHEARRSAVALDAPVGREE